MAKTDIERMINELARDSNFQDRRDLREADSAREQVYALILKHDTQQPPGESDKIMKDISRRTNMVHQEAVKSVVIAHLYSHSLNNTRGALFA